MLDQNKRDDLLVRFASRDIRALAQAISLVEDDEEAASELLAALAPDSGGARILGITGPPGAGKSTLTAQLAQQLLDRGETVGMLLIDPSSPFTGGAILGDRIRMHDLSGKKGLYIRSLASRGSLGGLSKATSQSIRLLDSFGFSTIIVETVGTGQAETDVVETVDTVVVVAVPGLGDDIQAMKAGIMEIADVFVVNKADREGADRTVRQIKASLDFQREEGSAYIPPVLSTVASTGQGVATLINAIDQHTEFLRVSGQLRVRREQRARRELLNYLVGLFTRDVLLQFSDSWEDEVQRIAHGHDFVAPAGQKLYRQYLTKKAGERC
jgi:LAO/AO transport system kinase